MRYDVLLLDADMTVFDFLAGERAAIGEVLAWAGIAEPDAPAVYSRINAACWADLEQGRIDHAELQVRRFRELFAHYGVEQDPAEGSARYVEALSRQCVLLPGAEEALRELSGLVPIALVTNGLSRVQRGRFERSSIQEYVREVIISSEVGFYKPDPRLIEAALRRMGTTRERALMVGDSLSSDILGAQRAGVDACWLNPEGKPCTLEKAPEYTIRSLSEVKDILQGRWAEIREVTDPEEKKAAMRTVLEALTDWFGVPESREEYIAGSAGQICFAAYDRGAPVGALCLKETGRETVELAVMGVLQERHRTGLGRRLVEAAKARARQMGYQFMQVKTVQMGRYPDYDDTNRFYQAMGFHELEVFPTYWDEANPCQIYVQRLGGELALAPVSGEDIDMVYAIQRAAYRPLYEKYHDDATSPYLESPETVREKYLRAGTQGYLFLLDGAPAGAVRVRVDREAKSARVSALAVLPRCQGRGIAQRALRLIEQEHGDIENWSLDTILQETGNCHLYEKLGYRQTGKREDLKEGMTLVFYEKRTGGEEQ